MKSKILAIAVVAMFAFVSVSFVDSDDGVDAASTTTGTYSVYAYDGTAWSSSAVHAYDGAQAVMESAMWQTTDSMIPKTTPGTNLTYNWETYGNITTFMGKTNVVGGETWSVFIFKGAGPWVAATAPLGSYRCFSDYAEDYQTANIALYYGSSTLTAISEIGSYVASSSLPLSGLTSVSGADFNVTFNMKIERTDVSATFGPSIAGVTDAALKSSSGITLTGNGSDCYLALKNALGANVSGVDAIPGSGYSAYSWINSVFGLGTMQIAGTETPDIWTDDTYAYWNIYDVYGAGVNHLTDLVLGGYSPLSCASDTLSTVNLIYKEVGM